MIDPFFPKPESKELWKNYIKLLINLKKKKVTTELRRSNLILLIFGIHSKVFSLMSWFCSTIFWPFLWAVGEKLEGKSSLGNKKK